MIDTGGGGFSGAGSADGDFNGSNSLTFGNVSGPVRGNSSLLLVAALVAAFIIWKKI